MRRDACVASAFISIIQSIAICIDATRRSITGGCLGFDNVGNAVIIGIQIAEIGNTVAIGVKNTTRRICTRLIPKHNPINGEIVFAAR